MRTWSAAVCLVLTALLVGACGGDGDDSPDRVGRSPERARPEATIARWVKEVAEHYRVIAIDLGGHGESGLDRVDWNLAAFGDDVVAVVDEIGANRVALVGHSMGGDAIVHAARRLGDRVLGLVWVDVFRSLGNEAVSSPEEVEAFVAPFRDDFAAAYSVAVSYQNRFADGGGTKASISIRVSWRPK